MPGGYGFWNGIITIDDLDDIDTTTTPPANGDTLIFNEITNTWVVGSPAQTYELPSSVTHAVVHGDDPFAERPGTAGVVIWIGSVVPVEAQPWDARLDSTSDVPTSYREVVLADFGTGLEPVVDASGDWLYGRYDGVLEHDA